jgi:hypothetical protein
LDQIPTTCFRQTETIRLWLRQERTETPPQKPYT